VGVETKKTDENKPMKINRGAETTKSSFRSRDNRTALLNVFTNQHGIFSQQIIVNIIAWWRIVNISYLSTWHI
jgi:hypothetical protein